MNGLFDVTVLGMGGSRGLEEGGEEATVQTGPRIWLDPEQQQPSLRCV